MSKKVINTPSSNVLMNSMRSIGYSFKTAIADIIDNSISAEAKNINIFFPIEENSEYICILDDGFGMNKKELLNAMKYGSEREEYGEKDLGRFGLGLKSASSSQCKEFTVASKKDNSITAYKWDLESVINSKDWICLELEVNEIDSIPHIEDLKKQKSGTIVLWENFDIAYKKNNGKVREYLIEEIDEAEDHLKLVFHRFLNRKFNPINIFINNRKLIGFDPFLENHPKTDSKKPSEMIVEGSTIKITQYILPHQNDLSDEDIELVGGINSLKNGQGFYVYRNERLIINGTWFKLNSNRINYELYKYGRIKVDIPNTSDDLWEIDIKKQNAVIPKQIINSLKKSVDNVITKSESKSSKRAKLTYDLDNNKIWSKSLTRDNKDNYFINTDSEFIQNFVNGFDDKERQDIIRMIDVLSTTLPYEDIYNSICNKKTEFNPNEEMIDAIVVEGLSQIESIKKTLHCTSKKAYEKIINYEPFNNEEIAKLLLDRIKK